MTRWHAPVGASLAADFTARGYEEFRGNGTAFQKNGTREKFFSAALAGAPAKNFSWTALGYAQVQSFASTFGSVNAARTAETPASDQFAVPATAAGLAWTGAWAHAGGARTSFGAETRAVRGETRENYAFAAGAFTRQRAAGGAQDSTGLFALHDRPLAADLRTSLGTRLDFWRERAGHRRESLLATGASLRDEVFAGRRGLEFSPSVGLVWTPAKNWRLRAAAQQAFRRPTLNELYRPFRAGNVVTEANAALRPEHVTTAELGAEFSRGPLALSAAVFASELRDAVGNITVARGPGAFPLFGSLAAGATGRQRLNLDLLRVRGLELSAAWRAAEKISLTAEALLDDATVRRAAVAPALAGKRLAQVPRATAALGATWHGPRGLVLTPRVRLIGAQFEDDENALRLAPATMADLGASLPLGRGVEFFLSAENLFDARLETGRSADGVVNTGTPRLLLAGLRGVW